MSEVLVGQSYYLRFDPKLWRAMQPYPPLGSLIAAAVLRQAGHSVAFFDAMLADSEAGWSEALDRQKPRFAVLFEDNFNYLSKMCLLRMREAAFTMIRAAKERHATVIVCGSDATDQAEAYIDVGADAVIHGEGEATLVELLARLGSADPRDLDGIAGLSLAPTLTGEAEGTVLRTPPRPVMRDLDALPFAAWDLIDLEHYRRIWLREHGRFSLNLVTTRGCPYHCNWCAKPIWGQTYHMRSADHVADELAMLVEDHAVEHVWFADDIMGLKRGWMGAFADALAAREISIPFKCLSRADLLCRPHELAAMRRAGCETVWIGAESGSQEILDAMEKGTTVEQIEEAARRAREVGIRIGFFLQFGYPGESRADIDRTRDLVRRCQPDEIGISVSYPLPGTSFFERVHAELGSKRNWIDSGDLDMMYHGPFTTAFYRQLHTVVTKEFRAGLAARQVRADLAARRFGARLGRKIASAAFHRLSLPWAALRLARLQRLPHHGIGPLDGGMSQTQAATPTPQSER